MPNVVGGLMSFSILSDSIHFSNCLCTAEGLPVRVCLEKTRCFHCEYIILVDFLRMSYLIVCYGAKCTMWLYSTFLVQQPLAVGPLEVYKLELHAFFIIEKLWQHTCSQCSYCLNIIFMLYMKELFSKDDRRIQYRDLWKPLFARNRREICVIGKRNMIF